MDLADRTSNENDVLFPQEKEIEKVKFVYSLWVASSLLMPKIIVKQAKLFFPVKGHKKYTYFITKQYKTFNFHQCN